MRLRSMMLTTALLLPLTAQAGHSDPWAGVWIFQLEGPKGGEMTTMKVRRVAATKDGERLMAQAAKPTSWALQIEIAAAKRVGLVQVTGTTVRGRRLVCAGFVDQGNMSGTCYGDHGHARPFQLRPQVAVAEEQPTPPPQPAPPVVVVQPAQPAPPPPPSCTDVLIEKGHHPSLLRYCKGAEPYCAVALLQKGHHPALLSNCKRDLEPSCASALIEKGHHPALLRNCKGVDASCAVALLQKGHHPAHLRNCR
ncbi:MAG: hypothetical protein H6747_06690 [Deltaproteobacteria bacterium]|nr:hypothetical protein [Deltaproteobacteria bacterium]